MLNKRFVFYFFIPVLCGLLTSCSVCNEATSGAGPRARARVIKHEINDNSFTIVIKNFRRAEKLYGQGNINSASKICDKIIKKHKNSPIIAEVLFLRGEIYITKHQYDNASNLFNDIILKHNNSPLFEAAVEKQFEIANALYDGQRPYYFGVIPGFRDRSSSVKHYEKVIKNAPFTAQAQQSLFNTYKIYRKTKKYDLAFAALDKLIDEYPESNLLPDAYLAIADMYQSLGKGPDYDQKAVLLALNYYGDFVVLFPTNEAVDFARDQVDKLSAELVKTNVNIGDFYYNSKHNPKAAYLMYKAASNVDCGDELKVEARAKMNDLVDGVPPMKTPVDFLFTKYEQKDLSEWIKNGCIETQIDDRFQSDLNSVQKPAMVDQITD